MSAASPRTPVPPPGDAVAFARPGGRGWTLAARIDERRGARRGGSWPAHGALVGGVVYELAEAEQNTGANPPEGEWRFSTSDTSPEAPNTGKKRRRPTGLGNQARALMPTPQAKLGDAGPDYARATRPRSGGDDLVTTVAKATQLPTPRASDATKGSPHQRGSSGDLTLPSAVHLLPTPTVGDARSSAIQTVRDSARPIPAGSVTLTDAARLLPTPSVADAAGGHRCRSGTRSGELLLPGVARALTTSTAATCPAGIRRRAKACR